MSQQKLNNKLYHFLVNLFDTGTKMDIHEFLLHSVIYNEETYSYAAGSHEKLHILVDPEIYKKYQLKLGTFKYEIKIKYEEFTHIKILAVELYPDLNKFQILQNTIVPIVTPWEEINKNQEHLIRLLRTASESIDYQNIGNAGRILLQKLSDTIFNPEKHISSEPIDLSPAKFKNRLHTYIKCELGGQDNKELRDFAVSAITTAENSVDLANKLTHDLNASSLLAETCAISVITVVSLIKLINNK